MRVRLRRCERSVALRNMRETNLDVVAPERIPLARVIGDKLGQFVRELHEQHGVKFHLGHQQVRIEDGVVIVDDVTRCVAADGGVRSLNRAAA